MHYIFPSFIFCLQQIHGEKKKNHNSDINIEFEVLMVVEDGKRQRRYKHMHSWVHIHICRR